MRCLSYPKSKITFEGSDNCAGSITFRSELGCEVVFQLVDRHGICDFRVLGGFCPIGDSGHDDEVIDLISRAVPPEENTELFYQFAEWLALRKRVPF